MPPRQPFPHRPSGQSTWSDWGRAKHTSHRLIGRRIVDLPRVTESSCNRAHGYEKASGSSASANARPPLAFPSKTRRKAVSSLSAIAALFNPRSVNQDFNGTPSTRISSGTERILASSDKSTQEKSPQAPSWSMLLRASSARIMEASFFSPQREVAR